MNTSLEKLGLMRVMGGIRMGGGKHNNLRYADDTTLMAESANDLKRILKKVKEQSAALGLHLNLTKTKIMTTEELREFKLDNENIEIVDHFNYLGAVFDRNGGCEREIKRRLGIGRTTMTNLNKVMNDTDVSINTKVRLVNTLVFPTVTYGSETWTINKSDRKKIDAFELWCWRRLLKIPWTARQTNDFVCDKINPDMSLEARIQKHKLSYFGHIMRSGGRMEKSIMLGKTDGKRSRGRPRTRWIDTVTEVTGESLERLSHLVHDRNKWRQKIYRVTKSRQRLDGT